MAAKDPPSHSSFAHLNAENAELYRAILGCFVSAKLLFALHLRPRDVAVELREEGRRISDEQLDTALDSLVRWGNLHREPDTAEVATVADFHRKRFLYRLTREGEATEEALEVFEQQVRHEGALQSAGLEDVREQLMELETLLGVSTLDEARVHRALLSLKERFESLTGSAHTFMAGLMRAIELHGLDEEGLLVYKEKLIDYLKGFVHKLMVVTPVIAELTQRIDARGLEGALRLVAVREAGERLDASPELEAELFQLWAKRWQGLRGWFVDQPGRPAQATELRQRAREAIPALLRAVSNLHDRRVQRSDRRSDLLVMARWFAGAPREDDTHRLYRAAFGLGSARHFSVDDATLDAWDQMELRARPSFRECPPLRIAPRMRKTGSHTRRGRTRKVEDRSKQRAQLEEAARREAEQIAAARAYLASRRDTRLSKLGELDREAFALFLDLLGEALAQVPEPGCAVKAQSTDGSISITLEPLEGLPPARIPTSDGTLVGQECRVSFIDLVAQAEEAAE